jgi:FkbM family methyltransferase
MLKRLIKRYLFGFLSTTYFQPLFESLYKIALWGMNIGLGSCVEDSGEKYALTQFAKTISLNDNIVIFDVGANQGAFALAALEILKTRALIYCFEPSPTTFRLLEERLHSYSNVRLYNFGLGECEGEAILYSDKEGSGCASLYKRMGLSMELTEKVQIRTLDRFCAQSGIDHIHYLKLDVEGHELSVLWGGSG